MASPVLNKSPRSVEVVGIESVWAVVGSVEASFYILDGSCLILPDAYGDECVCLSLQLFPKQVTIT